MKWHLLIGLLLIVATSIAQGAGFDDRYTARTGDLNGDGRTDIYLRHNPRIVMIPIDDLLAPIPLPNDVGDFVLQQNASGGFDVTSSLSASQKSAVNQWAVQAAISILRKDFNADNVIDVLLKGVGSVITNANDVMVFGSTTKGAPPIHARPVDAAIDQFLTDVNGWLEDPYYFDSGVFIECQIIYLPVLYYIGDGQYEIRYEPFLDCYYVFDPSGFSNAALNFLSNMLPAIENGEIIAQSPEASNVSQILQQLFGVPFFRNALTQGGNPESSPECAATADCVPVERYGRLMDILRELAKRMGRCTQGVPHHYALDTQICSAGGANCSTQNVYHEQLTHPAPGYLTNNVPVFDGQDGFAELGIPGPFDDGGEIFFIVRKPILWHQNVTKEAHLFYFGTVTRQTHVDGSAIRISTVGDGTGDCKRFNEIVGTASFKMVDLFIKAEIALGRTSQHAPIP